MSDDGYNPDGTPRFRIKDRDEITKEERAERIELEKAKNRWAMGRLFFRTLELLKLRKPK